MSNKSLPRNAEGGYKVTIPGGYLRENAAVFGAGTLYEREAQTILAPTTFARRTGAESVAGRDGGWKICVTHLASDPILGLATPPTVWRRVTWHDPQECDNGCAKHYAPRYGFHHNSANAHCRPVPCFPRAKLVAA